MPATLLTLPGEIRNRIYDYVFVPERKPRAWWPLDLPLTCKLLYMETHELAIAALLHYVEFCSIPHPGNKSDMGFGEMRRHCKPFGGPSSQEPAPALAPFPHRYLPLIKSLTVKYLDPHIFYDNFEIYHIGMDAIEETNIEFHYSYHFCHFPFFSISLLQALDPSFSGRHQNLKTLRVLVPISKETDLPSLIFYRLAAFLSGNPLGHYSKDSQGRGNHCAGKWYMATQDGRIFLVHKREDGTVLRKIRIVWGATIEEANASIWLNKDGTVVGKNNPKLG